MKEVADSEMPILGVFQSSGKLTLNLVDGCIIEDEAEFNAAANMLREWTIVAI